MVILKFLKFGTVIELVKFEFRISMLVSEYTDV